MSESQKSAWETPDSPGIKTSHCSPHLYPENRSGNGSEVAQSRPTLCDPMDCSLPGSSLHGILQARVLEWVAINRGTYYFFETVHKGAFGWICQLTLANQVEILNGKVLTKRASFPPSWRFSISHVHATGSIAHLRKDYRAVWHFVSPAYKPV